MWVGASHCASTSPLWLSSGFEAGSYLGLIDLVYHSTLGLRVIKKRGLTLRFASPPLAFEAPPPPWEKWRAKRFRIARQTGSAHAEPLTVVPRTTTQQPQPPSPRGPGTNPSVCRNDGASAEATTTSRRQHSLITINQQTKFPGPHGAVLQGSPSAHRTTALQPLGILPRVG